LSHDVHEHASGTPGNGGCYRVGDGGVISSVDACSLWLSP